MLRTQSIVKKIKTALYLGEDTLTEFLELRYAFSTQSTHNTVNFKK